MEAAPKIADTPARAKATQPPPRVVEGAGHAPRSSHPRKTAKEAASAGPPLKRAAAETHADAVHGPGLSAKERARVAGVQQRVAVNKVGATTHQTSDEATKEASAAAKEPQKQADGEALGVHSRDLEDNPPPDPLIVLKVMRIRWAIRSKRPVDEDDLGKAKPKDMAAEAGKEVSTDVGGAAKGVQTGYAPMQDKPTGTPSKVATPMPGEAPPPPAVDVHAASAVPDPVKPAEVSLAADKKNIDAQAKGAKLDREEVALIKDGPVAAARDAQGEFGKLAIWGPDAVVKTDKELRASATADFKKAEADALKRMREAREKKLADAHGDKEGTKTGEEERRAKLGERLQGIYAAAEVKVTAKLTPLVPTALKMWDDGIKPLSDNFDNAIGRVDEIIKEHKSHWYNRVGDFVAGLPGWIVDRYETAEQAFGDGAGQLAITISSWVNGVVRDCQRIISDARKEIDREIEGLDPELKTWALEQKKVIDKQFDKLSADAESARANFTKELGKKLTSAVREKDAKIQQLREMSKGLFQKFAAFVSEFIDDPLRAIVNGLLRILGIPPESFWALVEKFGKFIDEIADKPRVFANNLVAAIKLGIQQFKDNIGTHLLKGLLTWLTSRLKDAGVEPPADFSLKSIVTFILQLLGISWPKIRAKLVKYIGEQNMKRVEMAVQLLTTFINEGWDGLWKLLQDKLDPQTIVDAVFDAVKTYVIETVVKQAAMRLIMLFNPVGAVLQALELIYKAVSWILDNAAKIFTFIEAIVNGLANILAGAIGGAANLIEKALGVLVPVVIDLLASILGLGDLPDKVKQVVGKLQKTVDMAIDKIIDWVAKKLGMEKEEDKKKDGAIGIEVPVSSPEGAHKLYFDKQGDDAVLMIASQPMTVPKRLADFKKRLPEMPDEGKRKKAESKIDDAKALADTTDESADQLVRDFRQAPEKADADEAKTEDGENKLAALLSEIYALFGENPGDQRLPWHASYSGRAGSGDLSFHASKGGQRVTVKTSGLFVGELVEELDRFANDAGSSKPGKKAVTARKHAVDAESAGAAAIEKGASDTEKKQKVASSKLDETGDSVDEIANYRINDAGYILQRLEEAVRKELTEGKLKKAERSIDKAQGIMLGSFFEAQKKTSDTIAGLKPWEKSVAVRGIGRVRKTFEMLVTGIGKYEAIMEDKLSKIEKEELAQYLRDFLRAMSNCFVPVDELEGVEKARQKLVQRLVALLDVEQERAAGAWIQILMQVATLVEGNLRDVKGMYEADVFAHALPGFVKLFRNEGPRVMNEAAQKIIDHLAEEHGEERWARLKDKRILTAVDVQVLVKGLTDAAVAELKKVYKWLEKVE